jgi:hypothetical protein
VKLSKPKAKKVTAPQPKKPRKDPRVEYTYEKTIRYWCPVRGWVEQKVTVKRIRARYAPPLNGYIPAVEPDLKELIDDNELTLIDRLPDDEDKDGDDD